MQTYRAALTSVGIKIMCVTAAVAFSVFTAVFAATGLTPVAVPIVTGILAAATIALSVLFFLNGIYIDQKRRELVVRELKTRRIPLIKIRAVEADSDGALGKRNSRYVHLIIRLQGVEKIVVSGFTSLSSKRDKERTEEIAREISEILRKPNLPNA